MARGGKRKGAGRPEGPVRLEKEAARDIVRQAVFAQLQPLLEAQMANAKGLKYLVVRDKKTGKFERVSEALARAKQDSEDGREEIEVWEKDPSVQAFTDLMNRALDKPKEQAQDVNLTIHDDVIKHLNAARKRAQSHHP
jgi:DNA-directed RNA polymerase subunit K/omega